METLQIRFRYTFVHERPPPSYVIFGCPTRAAEARSEAPSPWPSPGGRGSPGSPLRGGSVVLPSPRPASGGRGGSPGRRGESAPTLAWRSVAEPPSAGSVRMAGSWMLRKRYRERGMPEKRCQTFFEGRYAFSEAVPSSRSSLVRSRLCGLTKGFAVIPAAIKSPPDISVYELGVITTTGRCLAELRSENGTGISNTSPQSNVVPVFIVFVIPK